MIENVEVELSRAPPFLLKHATSSLFRRAFRLVVKLAFPRKEPDVFGKQAEKIWRTYLLRVPFRVRPHETDS